MRVCNNIITNSLKHTNNGKVLIRMKLATSEVINELNYIHVGSRYDSSLT